MTFPELRREARRFAPRSRVTLVVAIGVAAATAVIWASIPEPVQTREPPVVVAVPILLPPKIVEVRVEAPAPLPPSPSRHAKPRRCPVPRFDAPMVEAPSLDDEESFPEKVTVAATNVGWVAIEARKLWVSRDAGATFATLDTTDEDDSDSSIYDVAFDCFGHVIVHRSGRIVVADGAQLSSTPIDGGIEIIGGGPEIVAVVHRENIELWTSQDVGRTWRRRVLVELDDEYSLHVSGVQDERGMIRIALTTDRHDDDRFDYELRDVVVTGERVSVSAPTKVPGTVTLAGDTAIVSTEKGLRVRTRAGWVDVTGLPEKHEAEIMDAPYPLVLANDALYRIVDGKARHVRTWPSEHGRESTEPATVDRAGRVWAREIHDSLGCDGMARVVQLGRLAPR